MRYGRSWPVSDLFPSVAHRPTAAVRVAPKQSLKAVEDSMVSCQGFREARWIEFGLVGVDGPGGTSDAPGKDDEGLGAR
jgi:hypothetical protein